MNGYVTPQYDDLKPRTLDIAGRAVSTLLTSQGVGDLYRLYAFCKRNGIDSNLAYIPGDLQDTSAAPFDPVFMTELYNAGHQMAPQGLPLAEEAVRALETSSGYQQSLQWVRSRLEVV